MQPIAFAIFIRCRQYSLGILAGCISPLMIWNGLPSSRKSFFDRVNWWFWEKRSKQHEHIRNMRKILFINVDFGVDITTRGDCQIYRIKTRIHIRVDWLWITIGLLQIPRYSIYTPYIIHIYYIYNPYIIQLLIELDYIWVIYWLHTGYIYIIAEFNNTKLEI